MSDCNKELYILRVVSSDLLKIHKRWIMTWPIFDRWTIVSELISIVFINKINGYTRQDLAFHGQRTQYEQSQSNIWVKNKNTQPQWKLPVPLKNYSFCTSCCRIIERLEIMGNTGLTQQIITCSKSTTEALDKGVNCVQS